MTKAEVRGGVSTTIEYQWSREPVQTYWAQAATIEYQW